MDCCMLKVMFLMDWVRKRQTTRAIPVWRREVEGGEVEGGGGREGGRQDGVGGLPRWAPGGP